MRGAIRGAIALVSLAATIVLLATEAYMCQGYPSCVGKWGALQLMRVTFGVAKARYSHAVYGQAQELCERRIASIQEGKLNVKDEAQRTMYAVAVGLDNSLAILGIIPSSQKPLEDLLVQKRIVPRQIAEAKRVKDIFQDLLGP